MTYTVKDLVANATTAAIDASLVGKKWYTSKTVWVNLLSAIVIVAQLKYGFMVDPSMQALTMSLINLALRKVSTQPIII